MTLDRARRTLRYFQLRIERRFLRSTSNGGRSGALAPQDCSSFVRRLITRWYRLLDLSHAARGAVVRTREDLEIKHARAQRTKRYVQLKMERRYRLTDKCRRLHENWFLWRWQVARLREQCFYLQDQFAKRLSNVRCSVNSKIEHLTPRRLVTEIEYHLHTLLFGHRKVQFIVGSLVTVLVCSLLIACGAGLFHFRGQLATRYSRAMRGAMERGRYAEAIDLAGWLTWLEPANNATQLLLAQSYDRVGNRQKAAALWDRLAPEGRIEYAPAHLVKIQLDLAADDVAPQRLLRIESELGLLADEAIDEAALDELRVRLWLRTGRLAEAQRYFEQHSDLSPGVRLAAAKTFATLDLRKSAHQHASLATKQFERQIAQTENIDGRLEWAEAASLIGDVAAAEQILRTGLVLHPRGPFAVKLAQLYLQLAVSVPKRETREALLSGGVRLLMGPATTDDSLSVENLFTLYQLHLARGQASVAFECLSKAVAIDRSKLLELARFQATRGSGHENAQQIASKLKEECFACLDERPFDRSLRLLTAEALVMLRDYSKAVEVLEEPYRQIREPMYSVALGRVYLAWWDHATTVGEGSSDGSVDLLHRASEYFPTSRELARRCHTVRLSNPELDKESHARLDRIEERLSQPTIQ